MGRTVITMQFTRFPNSVWMWWLFWGRISNDFECARAANVKRITKEGKEKLEIWPPSCFRVVKTQHWLPFKRSPDYRSHRNDIVRANDRRSREVNKLRCTTQDGAITIFLNASFFGCNARSRITRRRPQSQIDFRDTTSRCGLINCVYGAYRGQFGENDTDAYE